tara:strand:- start:45 stop:260 length:216 start_codon:yes stop_codon:yes gene_type:complete
LEGLISDKKFKQKRKMMNDDEKLITALFSELSESYNDGNVERFTSAFYTENVSLIGTVVDEIRLDIEQIRK